jgi:hypothetical protein
MATTASLLALIDTAIEALLTGGASSYSIGSRTVTKIDLPSLMSERRMLRSELARETQGTYRLAKLRSPR